MNSCSVSLDDAFLGVESSDGMQSEAVNDETDLLVFLKKKQLLLGRVVLGGVQHRLQRNQTDDL